MKHGSAVEALERWEAEHGKTSEILSERPALTLSQLWLWDAFWELSNTRARGFGAQPLQHSQIVAYCRLQGFDRDDARVLTYVMFSMDKIWLEWAEEKSSGSTDS